MTHYPPIYGLLTAAEAEVLAVWHQDRAEQEHLSARERNRHDVIAFRLFKAAAAHRHVVRVSEAA